MYYSYSFRIKILYILYIEWSAKKSNAHKAINAPYPPYLFVSVLYLYMKRHEKLDVALDLYRRGLKVVTIAQVCKVDRRTIHRWINEEGASRDDYRRMKEIAAIKAQKEAEKQQRKEDQIYEYTMNMCWEVLCRTLPWLEVRNWRDVERVMELIDLARANGCSRIYKHLSEQVAFFNEQELR